MNGDWGLPFRASKRLQELGIIGVWGDQVWLADKQDIGGQS